MSPTDDEREALLAVLVRHEVEFVLIGGAAIQSHGRRYDTLDVDVTPSTDEANLDRLADALNELGCRLVTDPADTGAWVPLPAGYFTARSLRAATVWNLATRHGQLDVSFTPSGFPCCGYLTFVPPGRRKLRHLRRLFLGGRHRAERGPRFRGRCQQAQLDRGTSQLHPVRRDGGSGSSHTFALRVPKRCRPTERAARSPLDHRREEDRGQAILHARHVLPILSRWLVINARRTTRLGRQSCPVGLPIFGTVPASRGSLFIRDRRGGKVRIGVGDFTGVDTWGPLILSSAEKCGANVDESSRHALQGAGRRDRPKDVAKSEITDQHLR